ncbi:MAG TPA: TonB-dependent receptor, partial [Pyrinomonadaceae bacterium]
ELFGESRANGTLLQTNRTYFRQLSVGGDLPTRRLGSFSFRAYGGTQVFDQNFTAVAADRNSETLTRMQRVPSQFIGLTVQWSRAVGASQTLVVGLDTREVRGASDEIVFVQNRPSSLVGAGGRERTVGFFVEDIVRLTPRLFLTGGVRVDRWREFAAQSATRPVGQTAATVNVFADRTETAISPRLSVLYKPGENISLSLAAYRAFRQPSLNELYRSFRVGDVLTLSNENLRAERMAGGEAGASVVTFNGRLNARGTFFWAEITRPIANVTLMVTPNLITRQRQNLGRTRSRGLELDAEARINDRWSLTGGYLFVDARVRSFPANAALEGLLIPQVARHQLTFQLRYTNPARLTVGLQGRAAGSQFDDDQNLFRLDRFFTLDALASRPVAGGVEIFIAGENLFNRRYALGRTPVTTVSPPLLIRVGLRLRFGAAR